MQSIGLYDTDARILYTKSNTSLSEIRKGKKKSLIVSTHNFMKKVVVLKMRFCVGYVRFSWIVIRW